jgi:hypothetical protein
VPDQGKIQIAPEVRSAASPRCAPRKLSQFGGVTRGQLSNLSASLPRRVQFRRWQKGAPQQPDRRRVQVRIINSGAIATRTD